MNEDTPEYAGTGIDPQRVAQTAAKDARILEYLRQDYDLFHTRVIERLEGFPDPEQHWRWTGNVHQNGYGVAWFPQQHGTDSFRVHRALIIWKYGGIPPHMVVDHDTRGCPRDCANPGHLVLLSQADNWLLGRRRQTHCKRGHPLSGDNLYQFRTQRSCKACMQEASRRQYARIREAARVTGMKVTEYMAEYGKSGERALEIIAERSAAE